MCKSEILQCFEPYNWHTICSHISFVLFDTINVSLNIWNSIWNCSFLSSLDPFSLVSILLCYLPQRPLRNCLTSIFFLLLLLSFTFLNNWPLSKSAITSSKAITFASSLATRTFRMPLLYALLVCNTGSMSASYWSDFNSVASVEKLVRTQ